MDILKTDGFENTERKVSARFLRCSLPSARISSNRRAYGTFQKPQNICIQICAPPMEFAGFF